MRGELNIQWAVRLTEAFIARIEGCYGACRETHHGDSAGVNARVPRQRVKCAVRIYHHGQRLQLRLIRDGVDDASTRETIQNEYRHTHAVNFLRPSVIGRTDSSRSVDQDDSGKLVSPRFRNSKFPCQQRRTSILVPDEDLLVLEC